MVTTRKIAEFTTVSTCNCLLAGELPGAWGRFDAIVGCYELLSGDPPSHGDTYRGFLSGLLCKRQEEGSGWKLHVGDVDCFGSLPQSPSRSLPGIFDLAHWCDESRLMACCTDGSIRLFEVKDGHCEESFFSVGDTMLTSCSPFYGSSELQVKCVCTAHKGAVSVYDLATRTVIGTPKGHEYDAWCSATTGADTALTGGDDCMLRLHDVRVGGGSLVGEMRFDAGVVSVSPISKCGNSATTLSLVGSYDEHLYLVDLRFTKQPLTSVSLGGGVWRCSRQLLRDQLTPEAKAAMHRFRWVQEANVLAVPVMQGGVALVRYDVTSDEGEIFTLLGHLHQSGSGSECDAGLCGDALFYDCAVLPDRDCCSEPTRKGSVSIVACDFYKKTVSLWQVDGIR
uniref:methylated diphthine methylhydrolase n=1 Tax=Trypanosoma congolense (strain IL3000) TaxID=1068625 RepID=F9W4C9_TRYCI|nr:unnamed protein product [Trypanosoma congolense IL3000]